jgi:hypothetical protein
VNPFLTRLVLRSATYGGARIGASSDLGDRGQGRVKDLRRPAKSQAAAAIKNAPARTTNATAG